MQPLQHQMMGYDRAITMFSPDGRLLQVEYAKKTVKQGSTSVGMMCRDGVILVADRRITSKLLIPESIRKIMPIDGHLAVAASGILSDARVLVDREQLKAQQHKMTYDTPIDVITVVKDISSLQQMTTQSGGLRPFGVSLLVAGADHNGLQLYETDPTAVYARYKAVAIGEADTEIEEALEKEYKDNLTMREGLAIIVKILQKIFDKSFSVERVEAAYIPEETKKVHFLSGAEVDKFIKGKK